MDKGASIAVCILENLYSSSSSSFFFLVLGNNCQGFSCLLGYLYFENIRFTSLKDRERKQFSYRSFGIYFSFIQSLRLLLGFPHDSVVKNLPANAGDMGLTHGLG